MSAPVVTNKELDRNKQDLLECLTPSAFRQHPVPNQRAGSNLQM